jgi:hypothetical protein
MIGSASIQVVGACIRVFSFLFCLMVVGGVAMTQDCSQKTDSSSTSNETTKKTMSSKTSNETTKKKDVLSGNAKGTVSQDGKTLVGDDGKSWTIANPDAVKGHEGHHVELKGSANSATDQIQVSGVKMLKGDKGSMNPAGPPVGGDPPPPQK